MKESEKEQANIEIAKACGWKLIRHEDGEFELKNPEGKFVSSDFDPSTTMASFSYKLPNYCGDLNAMHEAEKTFDRLEWDDYTRALRAIIQRDCNTPEYYVLGCERSQLIADFWFYHATAQQRTQAFLKVITNRQENKKERG